MLIPAGVASSPRSLWKECWRRHWKGRRNVETFRFVDLMGLYEYYTQVNDLMFGVLCIFKLYVYI